MIDYRTSKTCLILRDELAQTLTLTSDRIDKIIPMRALHLNLPHPSVRPRFLQEYAKFLADDKIIHLLPKILGKMWFQAKRCA